MFDFKVMRSLALHVQLVLEDLGELDTVVHSPDVLGVHQVGLLSVRVTVFETLRPDFVRL